MRVRKYCAGRLTFFGYGYTVQVLDCDNPHRPRVGAAREFIWQHFHVCPAGPLQRSAAPLAPHLYPYQPRKNLMNDCPACLLSYSNSLLLWRKA